MAAEGWEWRKRFVDVSDMGEIRACVHNPGNYEVLFRLLLVIISE